MTKSFKTLAKADRGRKMKKNAKFMKIKVNGEEICKNM